MLFRGIPKKSTDGDEYEWHVVTETAVASQERCKRLRTQAPAGDYAAVVTVSATTSSLLL